MRSMMTLYIIHESLKSSSSFKLKQQRQRYSDFKSWVGVKLHKYWNLQFPECNTTASFIRPSRPVSQTMHPVINTGFLWKMFKPKLKRYFIIIL